MSNSVDIEIDDRVSREAIRLVLVEIGCIEFDSESKGFSAYLPDSNTTVYVKLDLENRQILTEDYPYTWKVGARMEFLIDSSKPRPFRDVLRFLERLALKSEAKFVASFQYERMYANRDAQGVKFSDEFISNT